MDPKEKPEPYEDPLIDEVRQRRKELLADYDNDLDKFFEAIRKLEARHSEKIIKGQTTTTDRNPPRSTTDQHSTGR